MKSSTSQPNHIVEQKQETDSHKVLSNNESNDYNHGQSINNVNEDLEVPDLGIVEFVWFDNFN